MHPTATNLPRSIRIGVAVGLLAALATGAIVWHQAREEHRTSVEDLDRRAAVLLHRAAPTAQEALTLPDELLAPRVGDRLEGRSRLLGFALYRDAGPPVAAGKGVSDLDSFVQPLVARALSGEPQPRALLRSPSGSLHVLIEPLRSPDAPAGSPVGALAVLHDALYLDDRLTRATVRGLALSLTAAAALFVITTALAWAAFERPMLALADWMRRLRFGEPPSGPPRGLPVLSLIDESVHLAASFRAARATDRVASDALARTDKTWTRERLRAHARAALGSHTLVVVSNREPYLHHFEGGTPTLVHPASGLVTGLDPVLRACGGLWVAHGAGDADRATADQRGCIPVPPDDPRYTLRRVWLSKAQEQGYYYGFSNEGLWPLCHLTHERPTFRAADWQHYVDANQRFADAVLEELRDEPAVVMVQDYQLALVPGLLRQRRPELRTGLFWHIPWPNPEAFRICPFRAELLHGMLGADVIGFHLQQHCNNFLDTVDRMIEARLDWDHFSAETRGRPTLVRPFPISVQPWSERSVARGEGLRTLTADLRRRHGLGDAEVAVGVDRIDYTKGIAERFRAVERLLDKNPHLRGRFSLVQLGAPSRTHIPRYRDLVSELETLADAINWRFKADNAGWKPIHFLVGHHDAPTVYAFMKLASICVVSPLHDGMNLVAKEYIAAKGEADSAGNDRSGVLVLSEFAGAARDLPDALIVNPYDTEGFADALLSAVEMPEPQRKERLARLAQQVALNNIYRWAADFIAALAPARAATPGPSPADATVGV
jgi:trehalose 6-phosphate synthase